MARDGARQGSDGWFGIPFWRAGAVASGLEAGLQQPEQIEPVAEVLIA